MILFIISLSLFENIDYYFIIITLNITQGTDQMKIFSSDCGCDKQIKPSDEAAN